VNEATNARRGLADVGKVGGVSWHDELGLTTLVWRE
jgi:hypothetical protein